MGNVVRSRCANLSVALWTDITVTETIIRGSSLNYNYIGGPFFFRSLRQRFAIGSQHCDSFRIREY